MIENANSRTRGALCAAVDRRGRQSRAPDIFPSLRLYTLDKPSFLAAERSPTTA